MMEQLMDNEGKLKGHDGKNGKWQKTNGTWWEKLMEHVRKLMENDGTTNVTWKKLMESEGKWIESQKQQRKNKQQHILKKTSPYLISLFKVFQNSAVRIFFIVL